jgi:CTP synthase (UTP-ammonia lyase)
LLSVPRIAIVGDHAPAIRAHHGIPKALESATQHAGPVTWEWVHTTTLTGDATERLAGFHGVWCVPGSPYANTNGALAAIRLARTTRRAFLGTCGGFQHAMLEYARSVWDVKNAAHAELDPSAADPVIAPLSCGLVEVKGEVEFVPGSRLAAIYGKDAVWEGYHCNYGLSPTYVAKLASGPLRVSARDRAGDVRAVELDGHRFFFGTLYQPERSGLENRRHPLIEAFVAAVRASDAIPAGAS